MFEIEEEHDMRTDFVTPGVIPTFNFFITVGAEFAPFFVLFIPVFLDVLPNLKCLTTKVT